MNKTRSVVWTCSAALVAGLVWKYLADERAAHPPRQENNPYIMPIAYDKRPYYQQTRPVAHVEATPDTIDNGLIAGASFFANDYCPTLSYTGSLSQLRWHANELAEDKEYDRLEAEIHSAPAAIDAMCNSLLAKYPAYLYSSKVSHKWESNNLHDPHMFGKMNDWKMGRYSRH